MKAEDGIENIFLENHKDFFSIPKGDLASGIDGISPISGNGFQELFCNLIDVFISADARPAVTGADDIGDHHVGAVEDGAACFTQVDAAGC